MTDELEATQERLRVVIGERDEARAQLQNAQDDLKTTEETVQEQKAELERAEARIEQLREALSTIEDHASDLSKLARDGRRL
jgi:chromosome segregation ATPase